MKRICSASTVLCALLLASCSTDPSAQLGLAPASSASGSSTLVAEAEAAMPVPAANPRPDVSENDARAAAEAPDADKAQNEAAPTEAQTARTSGKQSPTGDEVKSSAGGESVRNEQETAEATQGGKRGLLSAFFSTQPAPPAAATQAVAAAAAETDADKKIQQAEQNADVAEAGTKTADEAKPAASDDAAQGDAAQGEQKTAEPAQTQRRGFLSAFFSAPQAPSVAATETATKTDADQEIEQTETKADDTKKEKVVLSAASSETKPVNAALFSGDALPGVRDSDSLFEVSRKSGTGDADLDLYEMDDPGYQVASAAGMARLAPNGLLKQRASVDTACLKPQLVHMLKTIERHYGKRMIITSGYRSPSYNRQVRGARNSMHMSCAAADIQIPGISRWELAKYARSLPGRGGVGTYCHTKSVHVDVGPERDWNWRCGSRG